MLNDYLPTAVNTGPWITAYTLSRLQQLPDDSQFVLPICSLATPWSDCTSLGEYLLPPLFREALPGDLQQRLVAQILRCFPRYGAGDNASRVRVVDLPAPALPKTTPAQVVAFSVDTAVEEHGPHLPLGTDTIQSYSVLHALQAHRPGLCVCRPVDYGQLTWGLPFGFSVDLTAPLLTEYVTAFTDAVVGWLQPQAVYVVDVHGSITHRQAIVEGLQNSVAKTWAFRWLHEPLAEFASGRGDQHAGGVETALVELANPQLIDSEWFPGRIDEIAAAQMSFETAVELTSSLAKFAVHVQSHQCNGVIGDIRNYHRLDASELFSRMLSVANDDLDRLLRAEGPPVQNAGRQLW